MNLHIWYVCAAVLAVNIFIAGSRAIEEDLYNPDMKVVDGFLAKPGQFPHQVSLHGESGETSFQHFCGGSILDKQHVVTAAHCALLFRIFKKVVAVYGTVSLNDKKALRREISSTKFHPSFSVMKPYHDLALLKLNKPITFNKWVRPVKLNTQKWIKKGTKCVASGWGVWAAPDITIHPELKGVYLPFVDIKECAANYSSSFPYKIDPKTMVCAGHRNGGNNVCRGDDGGPLICNKKLVGIVSLSSSCGTPGFPTVYTKVQTYVKWLKKQKVNIFNDNENSDEAVKFEDDESERN